MIEWCEDDLKDARDSDNIDWIIAYFHFPVFSSGYFGNDKRLIEEMVPLLEKYDVDIVFNGHDHHYERSYKDGVYYIVTGGGGSDLDISNDMQQAFGRSAGLTSVALDSSIKQLMSENYEY